MRSLMAGREAYAPQEFAERYFPAKQVKIAAQIHCLLANYVPVDLARLRPDDRLVQDLGIGQLDGLEPTFLVQDVQRAFGISIPDAEAEQLLTVRQLVSYIAQSQRAEQARHNNGCT